MARTTLYLECPVRMAPKVDKLGVFANSFRLVPDTEEEWFLDFLSYSHQENEACVVARIRVHKAFLSLLQERLAMDLLQQVMSPVQDA